MDATNILSSEEIAAVLAQLKRLGKRSANSSRNLIIFRLSCCCGLRRKEIVGLNLEDILVGGPKPAIRIRKGITKGRQGERKARVVPLWHDAGTLADIAAWHKRRQSQGANRDEPFVCGVTHGGLGHRFTPKQASMRWQSAIKILGPDRVRQLSIHKGRHTCASHLHAAGVPLAAIRDWLGHRNISITDIYVHALDLDHIQDVFQGAIHATA